MSPASKSSTNQTPSVSSTVTEGSSVTNRARDLKDDDSGYQHDLKVFLIKVLKAEVQWFQAEEQASAQLTDKLKEQDAQTVKDLQSKIEELEAKATKANDSVQDVLTTAIGTMEEYMNGLQKRNDMKCRKLRAAVEKLSEVKSLDLETKSDK